MVLWAVVHGCGIALRAQLQVPGRRARGARPAASAGPHLLGAQAPALRCNVGLGGVLGCGMLMGFNGVQVTCGVNVSVATSSSWGVFVHDYAARLGAPMWGRRVSLTIYNVMAPYCLALVGRMLGALLWYGPLCVRAGFPPSSEHSSLPASLSQSYLTSC